jgi:O-antigen ligase
VGLPYAGAVFVVVALMFVLGSRIIMHDQDAFLCIGVGVTPALILLRGLFVYNSLILIFATGIVLWLTQAPDEVRAVWRDKILKSFFLLAVLYWWLSYLNTGEYANNLRLVELVLSATAVKLLAQRRSYLATALLGLTMSAIAVGAGMLPNSSIRLGIAEIDGTRLGNPIQLGVPSVLVLILVLADGGQWMFLGRRTWWRVALALAAGEWLILSGSRGSWLSALGVLMLLGILSRRDRQILLTLGAAIVLVTGAAISTPLGEQIAAQYTKTLDSDRTLANRTSGRSAQWAALPDALAQSPLWGWGPGTGRNVVAYYTGRHLNWHSLYLQILAETGLIGFTALISILIAIARRAIGHWREFGELAPILAFIAYIAIGFSVSAYDANCGLFIGLAMLGAEAAPRYRITQVSRRVPGYAL